MLFILKRRVIGCLFFSKKKKRSTINLHKHTEANNKDMYFMIVATLSISRTGGTNKAITFIYYGLFIVSIGLCP
jgi:hypothetical protein